MASVVKWSAGATPSIGRAVVAIGVFDGVHLGHQALVRRAAAEARRLQARCVAVTFDRDPDQVTAPGNAAPQLMSLEDKCSALSECGADVVLVVPFDEAMAATPAATFLEEVLGGCCEAVSIHVGADFRFGRRAEGDIDTLYVWAAEHGGEVHPHALVESGGSPVTSTRVRRLVADGAVEDAARLLGRPHRLYGQVVHGRHDGAELGFPTANIQPTAFGAVPADGVYAAWVVLPDGERLPAAVSVGVPPTFPSAADVVEAHIMGFKGDLYGRSVAVDFVRHVREQRAFGSRDELTAAIASDVNTIRTLLGVGTLAASDATVLAPNGVVDDPLALEAAERAVADIDPLSAYDSDEEWAELVGPRRLSGVFGDAGFTAAIVTGPLQSAGIPYIWDPYPPDEMPAFRVGYGAVDRPFTLLVPVGRLAEARTVLGEAGYLRSTAPPTSEFFGSKRWDASGGDGVAGTQAATDREPLGSRRVELAQTVLKVVLAVAMLGLALSYLLSK